MIHTYHWRSLATRHPVDGATVWLLVLIWGWFPWMCHGFWSGGNWYIQDRFLTPRGWRYKILYWRPLLPHQQARLDAAVAAHYEEMDNRYGHLTS